MPKSSVVNVINEIVNTLDRTDQPLSTREIAIRGRLNRTTVEKYLTLLLEIERKGDIILIKKSPKLKLWKLQRKSLLSLPKRERIQLIREKYFPEPDETDFLLVHLFRRQAINPKNAIKIKETGIVKKLLKEKKLGRTRNGKVYLTRDGKAIARGVEEIYSDYF